MLYRLAMMLEGKILDILSIVHHLHTHGLQYLKIVMLAIAGHAIGLLTTLAHRRVLAFVHQHHLRILSFIRKHWGPVLAALVFGLLHVLQSPRHYGYSPDRWQIPRNFVLSLPSVQLGMVSMILAPLIIHCAAISLYTVITSLCFLPSTVRAVVPDRKMYRLLSAYILASIALFLTAYNLLSFAHLEAIPVGPDASYWIRDRGSQIFTSAQPRREIWESSRSSRGHHSNWVGFYEFIRLLWATAWEALPWAQKLLIVVPTVLFYGYFYIMPVMMPRVRKIQVLLRMEYQKYRRRQAVYRRYLQESV
ncbi:hypothetical protein FB45DRAFT_931757 [Roridomyces roridus]|uniref:Uncharacterized protein n=1 Tax=Roridomyces roridus TaxID=1738132 RepID=A0AAD7FH52_9AGAR|nr:hypothetical protein FB45DRAFT_931751 [Roridomyces roridus]KAJ7618485.1 hypothetical protein FB45DRAFT_931757 [Roridomyces roridus]